MTNVLPDIFKGIALFTPGGDLIYGIDPSKQAQWHIHLCLGLQEIWGLTDSPHFLVPGYTATVERWLDPHTQQVKAIAEVYPSVQRYIPLLQVLFDLEPTTNWQIAPWQEEHCNRAVIETYRQKFPQLWEERDLIIRLDPKQSPQLATESNNSETINQEQVG
ncbi:MAG: circadian clock KaiB family protein, partial [Waterburya sp.]